MKCHQQSSSRKAIMHWSRLDKILGKQCLSKMRKQIPKESRILEVKKRYEHRSFDRRERCTEKIRE